MFGHQPAYFLICHAVFLAIGVIAGVVVFQIPMRAWRRWRRGCSSPGWCCCWWC